MLNFYETDPTSVWYEIWLSMQFLSNSSLLANPIYWQRFLKHEDLKPQYKNTFNADK